MPSASAHTIADYLDALGARTPAPASGSGAAVAGAIAASLAELAARFSDEREAAGRLVELRTRLVELADEDAEAYTAFMTTKSDADRDRTIDVPLAIAEAAAEVASLARAIAEGGNPRVAGDAIAGAELAAAVARVGARRSSRSISTVRATPGSSGLWLRLPTRSSARRRYAPSPWRRRPALVARDRAGRDPAADHRHRRRRSGWSPTRSSSTAATRPRSSLDVLDRLADRPDGKLIDVTAITPTPAGEGKTTTSVSLTQGFGKLGKSTVLCLREASLGPVFGIKGGAAGGGYTQVVPMEDMNLHFTGDIHAIGAANNLLAAMLEAHLLHGNTLGIDPLSISWRRCVDINDRALRDIVVGIGGRANGYTRQTGFDITAASEVMAIVAVARDLHDLRSRLGAITVGQTYEGEPVTAEQLKAAGAMTVLLKDTIKPNLVQTLEGQPVFVHCGPFANIAHGNNSLVADRVALKLGDYVVTESGFGSDMGMEKFFDIVCRVGALRPSATVLVATVKALKHHGGDQAGGLAEIEAGAANLARHLGIVREFGLNAVVAVNRFPTDTTEEIELVKRLALEAGAYAAEVNDGVRAAAARARRRSPRRSRPQRTSRTRSTTSTRSTRRSRRRSRRSPTRAYGADGIFLLKTARDKIAQFNANGLDTLPICMAKTHLSLSHDAGADERADRLRRDRSATSAPTRAPAGSSRSAATCRRCPA